MKDYFFVSVDCGAPSKNQYKVAESMVSQLKKELYDFMTEIESLSFINYPKMLSLDVCMDKCRYSHTITHTVNMKMTMRKKLKISYSNSVLTWRVK